MAVNSVLSGGMRAGMSEFADLPDYIEPAVQTKERNIVRKLIGILDTPLDSVDANVGAYLPPGSQVVEFSPYGTAYWTRTAAIKARLPDGRTEDFFLKITQSDVGKSNLRGEYESMSAIYRELPDFVPQPVAVGSYTCDSDIHFYLMRFVDMTLEVPDPQSLALKVSEMHQKCLSPTGKYGFAVPTNNGPLIQLNAWTESWEEACSNLLQNCFDFEQGMHGKHEEMQNLWPIVKERVIPRLLRPLETGGNHIQPCLVHGDLWDGSTSINAETDQPLIFDANSCYAHNEFELAPWGLDRHRIFREYISAYRRHIDVSQPEEDFEGRLRLYVFRFNLTSSSCYLNNLKFRDLCIGDMQYLVAMYSDGYQGKENPKGAS